MTERRAIGVYDVRGKGNQQCKKVQLEVEVPSLTDIDLVESARVEQRIERLKAQRSTQRQGAQLIRVLRRASVHYRHRVYRD